MCLCRLAVCWHQDALNIAVIGADENLTHLLRVLRDGEAWC